MEQAANHLMFTQMSRPARKPHLRMARLCGARIWTKASLYPFSRETLDEIRRMADASRVIRRI